MPDLKLLALDSEDLEVISATTQDAVVRVGDMGYAKADRRFALLMNRYAWEEGSKSPQRKRAALHFDRVDDVKVIYHDKRECVVRNVEIKANAVFSIADKDLTDCSK